MVIKLMLATGVLFAALNVSAQDFDMQSFYQKYDQNQDQKLTEQEFTQVQDFAPYSYANTFQGKNSHHKIFKKLDMNQDGKLNSDEMQQVNQVIENPAIGWVWPLDANRVI